MLQGVGLERFQRELLSRLPLAEAVLLVLAHVLEPSFLDRLFEENRGRGYEDSLTFPVLVDLVREALLVHGGSGRQSFLHARQRGTLPVALGSVYAKLGRLPMGLSLALLRQGTQRLRELFPPSAPGRRLPECLKDLEVTVYDGKTLKHVVHRLLPTRPLRGKLLAGKLAVGLDLRRNLALAMNASADSFRNDVPLAPALHQQVRSALPGSTLRMADRQYCNPGLLGQWSGPEDHFLVRYNRGVQFCCDRTRPARQGIDARGWPWVERWGYLGAASNQERLYVRRIWLRRPGQQEDVILVTDLLEPQRYPASELLEAYLLRGGIERVFQEITEVFELRKLIGSTPQAAIFQGAFCLLLYNIIQVVKAYVAPAGAAAGETVSTELLFRDVTRQLVSWSTLADREGAVAELSEQRTVKQMRQRLRELLGGLWTERWLKAKPRQYPPRRRTKSVPSARACVWRVLQRYRRKRKPVQHKNE